MKTKTEKRVVSPWSVPPLARLAKEQFGQQLAAFRFRKERFRIDCVGELLKHAI